MLGGLHIEMAILSAIVDWVQESGWTAVINTANVTTEGRADNLLRGVTLLRHSGHINYVL